MAILDPTKVRLSPHFLLSDMMGCNSVYALGLANVFDKARGEDKRLANGQALCHEALEPILATVGSFSISYGFISPELSREIVRYQDWRTPSHHRWDLGAAVDICPHRYVLQSIANHASPESGAPILFALEHLEGLPLSRLITYSESPYLCVAVSAEEVEQGNPRGAWYENRFTKGAEKPRFLKYPTLAARQAALRRLEYDGLEDGWVGAGYPTYHGGGRRQLHHLRASRFTMVSDWLYDRDWVTKGVKNCPTLNNAEVVRGFKAAGATYDRLLAKTGLLRLSIVSGYTCPLSRDWIEGRDWLGEEVSFEVIPPDFLTPSDFVDAASPEMPGVYFRVDEDRVIITVDKSHAEEFEESTSLPANAAIRAGKGRK